MRASRLPLTATKTSLSRMSGWAERYSSAAPAAFASSGVVIMSVLRRLAGLRARDRVALGHPAPESLVEDALVPPPELVENVAGPPGQRVRARSVEDDPPRAADLRGPGAHRRDRHRPGPLDVGVDVRPPGPHVDEVDPVPPVEEGLELVEMDVVHGIVGRRGGRRAQEQPGEGEGRADGLAHPRAILP